MRSPTVERQGKEQPLSVAMPNGLVSILVSCCGQLEYTKLCVPSLLRHTRQPFELIFLDIGSLDGTSEYLAGFGAAAHVRVEIVRSPTDLGIAQAVQDALKRARGEFLVLLNNDTIVTDAWLNQMIGLATMTPNVGLVGPMSNYAAPPQLVEHVPYRIGPRKNHQDKNGPVGDYLIDVSAVDAFARTWRDDHKGKWGEADRLGGFCLLMKREENKGDASIYFGGPAGTTGGSGGVALAAAVYEYDFGDSWEHEVLIEGVVQPDSKVKYPLCLEGARACPPDDCGGVWGYADFLDAIHNKDHEQHEEMLEWIGGRFDSEDFDPIAATKAMKKGLPDWRHEAGW